MVAAQLAETLMVEIFARALRCSPWLLLALLLCPSATHAHVLDEYLQSALVDIDPTAIRLQINLTPGVEVADQILALLDSDHDDAISATEAIAYAELFARDLAVQLDGREAELMLTASNIPAPTELRTGWGILKMDFTLSPGALKSGAHRLTINNRHMPALGVYLLNAASPASDLIKITRQTRSANQSHGEIEFTYNSPAEASPTRGRIAVGAALVALFAGISWIIARIVIPSRPATP